MEVSFKRHAVNQPNAVEKRGTSLQKALQAARHATDPTKLQKETLVSSPHRPLLALTPRRHVPSPRKQSATATDGAVSWRQHLPSFSDHITAAVTGGASDFESLLDSVVGGGASFKKLSDGLPTWPVTDEEDDLEGSFSDDEL